MGQLLRGLSRTPRDGRPYRLSLTVIPAVRRTALAGRLLAHLHRVSAGRRRVAILHGAEELPPIDLLTRLRDIADTTFFAAGRYARRAVPHVIRRVALVDGREVSVAGGEELRGVRIEPGGQVWEVCHKDVAHPAHSHVVDRRVGRRRGADLRDIPFPARGRRHRGHELSDEK